MSLQFIMGNSGAGKSRYAYEKILAEAARHPEKNYLIVVPEQFTMQTQKELVSLHPAGGILNIDILSFQRLAYRIFEETGGSLYPVLEETGKSLVVKRVAQEKKKELTILGSTLKRTGAVSQMKSLISELKQYQIAPSELDAWAEETGEKKLLAAKLKDTGVIYRAFEEYLENRYVTAEDVLEVLAGKLEESALIKNSEVLVDGFTGFTPVQICVLGKLFRLCAKVYMTIIMDEREDPYKKAIPHQLFAMSRQLVQQLMKAADEAGCPVEPEIWVRRSGHGRFQPGSTMDQLEQRLFRYGKRGFSGNGIEKRPESGTEAKTGNPAAGYETKQQGIYISVAPNPRAELEETVRLIHRMVREDGMRYQDFAVLTGDLSVYGTYAREIFEKCGVPYFVDEKHSVLMNPFVEFLRAAIEMVVQSFSYESVFRYLRCGLSSLNREETDAMENYVLALGIRGLKAYAETWTRGYRSIKPDEVPLRNLLREKFYEEVQPFAEQMKKKEATVRERTEALYALVVQNQIQEKLEERRCQFEQQGQEAFAKEYSQIYGIVMELLDKIVEVLGDEKMTLAEYQEILEAGFAEASVGIIPPTADQVLIGDNERSRLKDIRVLFFVGVNDGLIPRHDAGGGILSEYDREELERADAKLSPTARETMYQQKFHLYRNLTKPSERLYLSFAKAGASGEAQNPSYLINEIRKLFPEIPVRDIEKKEQPEERLEMPRSGEALFLEELGKAAEGEIDPLFEELYRWYAAHPEAGIPAETYRKAAFLRCADGVIGRSAASALYGDTLKNSATRLEKYAACAFAHFMEFGLQIRERDQYELKAADMGTVMHEALEKFSKKLQENGETWKTVTDDSRDRLIEECVEETMADYGNTIFQSSSRNQYRIIRVKRILKRTVWALQQQIRQGEFEPGEFEVSFSMEDSLSAINIDLSEHEKMRLRGRIDRVDLCETDDKVYVKIIDYKTGNTSLDLVALYYGLQLQLAVYLDAAVELEQKKHPGKQVEPAGVFYYHIDDPMLDQEEDETDEAWGRRMLKALRMDGLVNADRKVVELLDRVLEDGTTSDVIPVGKKKDGSYTSYSKVASPEQFDVIRTYTRKKVREIGEGIFSGNVKISPYQRDGATACAYCEYQGICGFDQKIQGYEYRKLKGMDTELLMKAMQEITQSDQKE